MENSLKKGDSLTNHKSILDNPNLFLTKRTTIASYPGGKSDRRKHAPLYLAVPDKINCLIEPFAGLANFFLVLSPRVSSVWLNDCDLEVYSLLKCVQEKSLLKELINRVQEINPIERKDYYSWKELRTDQQVELALRKLIILNCSPNGAGGGYSKEKAHRKWYVNKPKIWSQINEILSEKSVKITNFDYEFVLKSIMTKTIHKESLLYLDPPYYDVAQKGKLYGDYNTIDLLKLKGLLKNIGINWILSNRDCDYIREIFKGYHQITYNTYNDMNNQRQKNPETIIMKV